HGPAARCHVVSVRVRARVHWAQACALGKPWVLDPVGCGATPVRTRACLDMLRCKPTVVRGNASEILALAGAAGTIKGVDSCESSHAALPLAKTLAQEHQCIVAVSGEVDYVTDGSRVLRISGGDALLTYVTAAGCALTALIAAFVCEAPSSPLMATAHAMAIFKAAADGAVASIKLSGLKPGTIKGVDSCESSHAALPLAQKLAQEHQCIVAVSGEVDYVTDGSRVLRISGGDALLTYVTAAGCALTALIAAFVCEAPSSPLMATAHAMAIFKAAADGAVASIKLSGAQPGPGSF
ncbi:hydroxyethylthiazole kinase, partial [Haematococcus lacustris]